MDIRHITLRETLRADGYAVRYTEKKFPRGLSTFIKVIRSDGITKEGFDEIIRCVAMEFNQAICMEGYREGMCTITFSFYEIYNVKNTKDDSKEGD